MTSPRQLRDGRYVLSGMLGQGAQGTTWDAIDRREGRPVAIKQFDVRGAHSWKDVELAEREARVLGALSHPKLPRYVEHFEEDGALYLVMEKIEGTPLSVLRKGGPMGEEDVARLLRDADEVLTYLHGRAPPVIHRDLKPSNVIRRPDGSFAFVDFGAVRDRMRPEGGSTVVGTFGYMAPEQFQGRAGPGSDVYAIGATALALLTGEEPENLPHRGLAIDVHAALAGRASRRLEGVLAEMLEPNPERRPTRIGPLLERSAPRGRARDRGDRAPRRGLGEEIAENIRDRVERDVRRTVERATRHARRAEARARRHAERVSRAPEPPWPAPWFVVLAFGLGLAVAQLAVVIALRVVVPTVLLLLSAVFGRGLRDAAKSVSAAGERAWGAIERARGYVRREDGEKGEEAAEGPKARVATGDAEGVRVDVEEAEADADESEEAKGAERGRRRGA